MTSYYILPDIFPVTIFLINMLFFLLLVVGFVQSSKFVQKLDDTMTIEWSISGDTITFTFLV